MTHKTYSKLDSLYRSMILRSTSQDGREAVRAVANNTVISLNAIRDFAVITRNHVDHCFKRNRSEQDKARALDIIYFADLLLQVIADEQNTDVHPTINENVPSI